MNLYDVDIFVTIMDKKLRELFKQVVSKHSTIRSCVPDKHFKPYLIWCAVLDDLSAQVGTLDCA